MKGRKGILKWILFTGVGIALLVVGSYMIWDSVEKTKEIQQIELELGFEIKVVDRQSHGTLRANTRTYLVKRLDGRESNLEYLLYLNEEDQVEHWAMVKDGKTIKPNTKENK